MYPGPIGGYPMGREAIGVVVATAAVLTCSSSSSTSHPLANPCATKGATYLEHFVQESGDCGALPDEIVNIGADGTLTSSSSVSCATVSQNGCTAQDSDCTTTNNGVTCMVTTDVTFARDGSSASGLESVTCTGNGASCTSTYQVSAARQ